MSDGHVEIKLVRPDGSVVDRLAGERTRVASAIQTPYPVGQGIRIDGRAMWVTQDEKVLAEWNDGTYRVNLDVVADLLDAPRPAE